MIGEAFFDGVPRWKSCRDGASTLAINSLFAWRPRTKGAVFAQPPAEVTMEVVDKFLTEMYQTNSDFIL